MLFEFQNIVAVNVQEAGVGYSIVFTICREFYSIDTNLNSKPFATYCGRGVS